MNASNGMSSMATSSYPGMPPGWRDAVGHSDALFACNLVEETMSPYWSRRQMRFSRSMFMKQWYDFDAMILESMGEPAGVIAWSPVDDSHCHLRELHLVSHVRGLGKGKQILEAWIASCRGAGFKRLTLKVFTENPARDVYQHVGFDVVGAEAHIPGLLRMSRSI